MSSPTVAPRQRSDRTRPGRTRCALCGRFASTDRLIPIRKWPSPQVSLLYYDLLSRNRDLEPDSLVSRGCLERAERSLQRRQLVRRRGELRFADLLLGKKSILPIPQRLGASIRLRGRGVTIAFVDSGFAPHPDLILPVNRVVAAFNAVTGREAHDFEGDFSEGPPASAWHGTMAAAVAAGSGYLSKGDYRGLASEARLVLIKAMTPEGRIRTPQVRRALEWILENYEQYNIRIVNMSVGVDESTRSLRHPVVALVEELVSRGVVVVAAAGNDPTRPLVPPGAAPSAITVGGYNDNNSPEWRDRELWHSSYGEAPGGGVKPEVLGPSIWVAAPILLRTGVKSEAEALFWLAGCNDRELMANLPLLAPETGITEELRAADTPRYARALLLEQMRTEKLISPSYKHVDGTSFAAPIVSSLVAQMLEEQPWMTPEEVRAELFSTARRLEGVPVSVQGYGAL